MKKFLMLVVIIAVAAGAYYALMNGGKGGADLRIADGQEMELSASFMCDDGSHFVAEFPTMNTVTIVVDGTITGVLPQVASTSGKKYENLEWIYTFRGETAKAEHKVTTNITSCKQPFDANNAPVNFGD